MENNRISWVRESGPKRRVFLFILIGILIMLYVTPTVAMAYNSQEYLKKGGGHYFDEMTEEEKDIYTRILNAVVAFEEEVVLPRSEYWTVYDVLVKFRADFPEIFWLDVNYGCQKNGDDVVGLVFSYVYTEEEIDEINSIINDIVTSIRIRTDYMDDYHVAFEVFKWVCEHVNYNKNTYNPVNAEQAFLEGTAICGGFAKSYAILAQKIGLDCDVVIGARSENAKVAHAWDQVYIGDRTIYIDCTWGDHSQVTMNNKYFDAEEEDFLKNHIQIILH